MAQHSDGAPLPVVTDADLQDLRDRLQRTRWPEPWPGVQGWDAGTPADHLRRLADRWAGDFDWRRQEAALRALPWRSAAVAELPIRYLLLEGEGADPLPLVLVNGWPSTALELVPLAERLARPAAHGSAGPAFTVVVPVLPGFPGTPQQAALPPAVPTPELWHRLLRDELGFARYGAHGGDLGAGIASRLAEAHPEAVAGLHLLAVADPAEPVDDPSEDEQAYLEDVARWSAEEGAYEHQQMTRPATLAYGLSDSPVGLLAWLLEKYHAWTDRRGGEASALTDDLILTQASLYWFGNSIGTSFRPYFEFGRGLAARVRRVEVPTAVALFPADLSHPPRSWAERTYRVTGTPASTRAATSRRARCPTCWRRTCARSSARWPSAGAGRGAASDPGRCRAIRCALDRRSCTARDVTSPHRTRALSRSCGAERWRSVPSDHP